MNDNHRDQLARYLKALGHPVRLRIIERLAAEGECLTGDLSSRLPVAASTTSQHLAILREAGLICGTIDGPRRCYCINAKALSEARKMLAKLGDGCC
jgi:ArsR family transcriptional regulator